MPSETRTERGLRTKVLELLDENDVMAVATLRPDGWPQATVVGFIHDDLDLYFGVAMSSQKLKNIRADPRISIALGRHAPGRLRGLSMAAHASEVVDREALEHVNDVMRRRYPGQSRFGPREVSATLVKAEPHMISIIDVPEGPGEPELTQVGPGLAVRRIDAAKGSATPLAEQKPTVWIGYADDGRHFYRPGAPF